MGVPHERSGNSHSTRLPVESLPQRISTSFSKKWKFSGGRRRISTSSKEVEIRKSGNLKWKFSKEVEILESYHHTSANSLQLLKFKTRSPYKSYGPSRKKLWHAPLYLPAHIYFVEKLAWRDTSKFLFSSRFHHETTIK